MSSNFWIKWIKFTQKRQLLYSSRLTNGNFIKNFIKKNSFHQKPKPNSQSGPDFCPQFIAFGNDNEILVASGTKKSIKTKIRAIGDFLVQTRSNCKFYMDGKVVTGNAQIFGETIYCDVTEFKSKSPKTTVKFDIFWNKTKPYANPDNVHGKNFLIRNWLSGWISNRSELIHEKMEFFYLNFFCWKFPSVSFAVLIYNCREMANSCATCFELSGKYNCGWCKSSSTCEVANQCSGGSRNNWIKRTQTCP